MSLIQCRPISRLLLQPSLMIGEPPLNSYRSRFVRQKPVITINFPPP